MSLAGKPALVMRIVILMTNVVLPPRFAVNFISGSSTLISYESSTKLS